MPLVRLLRPVLLAGCFWLSLAGVLRAADRPNLLLILGDNWRWPNAGALGDPLARTPTFDRIAREGALFTHVFNPAPSCSPCRASLLTGKYPHQLGERANLWSGFPQDTPVFTQLLRAAGYDLGYNGKPWGPGIAEASGWKENPVGPRFKDFAAFLAQRGDQRPFFYWIGNTDTATRGGKTPFVADSGLRAADVKVPPELPDCLETRQDLLNYYGGIARLDIEAARALQLLEQRGELERTIVVYTSDNGWQLPRGLGNVYDRGSRVPLAIRWGGKPLGGRQVDGFVNLGELGPTFLELAGLTPPPEMSLHSLVPLLKGATGGPGRGHVFIERERHADVRHDHLGYPVRAIRTEDFLYVHNLRPERWPAGDPDVFFVHGRPYGDVDTTLVKDVLLAHLTDPAYARQVGLSFARRPAEELYDLRVDPDQLLNVATDPRYTADLRRLRNRVEEWRKETGDPRLDPNHEGFDRFPYLGAPPKVNR
jgi:arylsulfatase A-like enzyme